MQGREDSAVGKWYPSLLILASQIRSNCHGAVGVSHLATSGDVQGVASVSVLSRG